MKLIFGCILFIGLVALLGFGLEKTDEAKSSNWPTASAKWIEIKDKRIGIPIIGRFLPISMPYAKYSYIVKDKAYIGEKTCGPCLSYIRTFSFKAPKMIVPDSSALLAKLRSQPAQDFSKIMEETLKSIRTAEYEPILVRYQADHPEISVPDPALLQSSISLWWTSILLITLGGLGLAALIYHSYVVAPVDDPALSLDKSLASGKRYYR
jgi:hypothetical protein